MEPIGIFLAVILLIVGIYYWEESCQTESPGERHSRVFDSLLSFFLCAVLVFGIIVSKRQWTLQAGSAIGPQKPDWREEQVARYFHGEMISRENAWWLDADSRLNIDQKNIERVSGKKMSGEEIHRALHQQFWIQYNPYLTDTTSTSATRKGG